VSDAELTQVFAPRSAATGKPIELAMQRLWLVGRITGVGARLLVRHVFRSGEKKPLEAIYGFMLPRDAALRRFRISGQGFSVASELKPIEKVRETYEEALTEGHTAAMAAQYGDGMVNLTVGNIRPGEEVVVNLEVVAGVETRDDGIRFRFPFTLAPAYHARAKAAEVAPGVGEIELPADEFGDLVLPQFVSDASALHEVGFDLAVSMGHPIVETASPSHAVRAVAQGLGRSRVSLATAKDLPDRDLVLDVKVAGSHDGVLAGTGKDGRGHFAAVLPSALFKDEGKEAEEEPRRIVFLIDRSGSMGGVPIEQARRAVAACLGALAARDSFGIVAFDDSTEVFGEGLAEASMENREKAGKFLEKIDARGGTELAAGVGAAAAMLKRAGGGGDILVVTDGQVAGTQRILDVARSEGARLHTLGIGSASQDRFLTLLARETGGVSRFLTPRERVDMGALELFASVGRPLGSRLGARVKGFGGAARIAPVLPTFVFAGTPVVVFGDTEGAGEGMLVVDWEKGGKKRTLEIPLSVGASADDETLRLLQGARLITDMESQYPAPFELSSPGNKREADRVKRRLVTLSEAYGLASREMGLVAVVERAGDRPGDLPVTRVVPVGPAQDVAMGAYFGMSQNVKMCRSLVGAPALAGTAFFRRKGKNAPAITLFESEVDFKSPVSAEREESDAESARLIALASSLEPDGGMPGKDGEERVLATVLALLRFLAAGHTATSGALRVHVVKMIGFLESAIVRAVAGSGPLTSRAAVLEEIVNRAKAGKALPGKWDKAKPGPALWSELEKAL
jgi:Ca-activated chloride channel family protein